jgi:UDP-N-acetylmuramoyl-tripeptide--D-alanyl-D-alanine ligase
MGSQEGVAREKAKLAAAVREKGLAIVSADYPLLNQALPDRADLGMVRFSCRQAQVPYRGEYLGHSGGRGVYRLHLDGTELEVAPGFREGYQLENILAAAAAAWELGCDAGDVEAGLADAELPEHRSQMIRVCGWSLIDDCYNANPMSVRCALQSARELAGSGTLIAILGDMLELGDEAEAAHQEMGREAARQGVDHLLYSGSFLREVEHGFREAGGRDGPHPVQTDEELRSFCRGLEPKEGSVLLKASRGGRLERFLHVLQRELGV